MNRDRFRFGFGGGRRGSDKLFTGQRQIAELGIYHYGARFYSPKLGRFLSADTIVPGYANPQNLNRFSYVTNNPLRYTDPTGHMRVEEPGGGRGCSSNPQYCKDAQTKYEEVVARKRAEKRKGGGGTPTSTPTPCPQVAAACLPTSTSTPSPTATSTPTITPTLINGPSYTDYSTPASPYLDWSVYIDSSKVDFIDAGIDVIGLSADLASLYPPAAPVAQTIGTVAEGIGLGKSVVELIQGNPQSMFVSQTTNSAKAAALVFRLERMIPIPMIGSVGNLVSLGINLQPQVSVEWVTP